MKNIIKNNMVKLALLIFTIFISTGLSSANPGFNIAVTPVTDEVASGGTATFSVTLTAIDTLDVEEFADLSVTDSSGTTISWVTTFGNDNFLIGPYGSPDAEKTVTLAIDVPSGTTVGDYILKVKGDGYLPDYSVSPPVPDTFLGSLESSEFPITVIVTAIPEFPTVALPVISVLGLFFLMSRRKDRN
jgi:hypothetical protein